MVLCFRYVHNIVPFFCCIVVSFVFIFIPILNEPICIHILLIQRVYLKRILKPLDQETGSHFLHSRPLVRCGTKLKFRSLFRSGAGIAQTKFILRDRFSIQSTYPASRHWDNQITLWRILHCIIWLKRCVRAVFFRLALFAEGT